MAPPLASAPDGRRANFTIPNATCPVCGTRVFFYQNEYGSRVFFDSLGPPWPKHPCTDQGQDHRPRTTANAGGKADRELTDAARKLLATILRERSEEATAHLDQGWKSFVVQRRSDHEGLSYYVVRPVLGASAKRLRFSTLTRDDLPAAEDTIYIRALQLSFFSFELFEPVEVEIALKVGKTSKARRKKARRKRRSRA